MPQAMGRRRRGVWAWRRRGDLWSGAAARLVVALLTPQRPFGGVDHVRELLLDRLVESLVASRAGHDDCFYACLVFLDLRLGAARLDVIEPFFEGLPKEAAAGGLRRGGARLRVVVVVGG